MRNPRERSRKPSRSIASGSISMNGRYLLDTNIAIAIVEKEIDFRDRPDAQGFLSSTVLGELFFGVEKSSRVEENLKRLQQLRSTFPVFLCDEETARHYG